MRGIIVQQRQRVQTQMEVLCVLVILGTLAMEYLAKVYIT